jgi:hypothetical protein
LFQTLRERFRDKRFLETVSAELNPVLRLPRAVSLELAECGEVRAYYDPAAKAVVVCYEWIAVLMEVFDKRRSRDQLDDHVDGTLTFTLYHEVAHALVDLLALPVTGREEDAADQLATLLLLRRPAYQGERALVSASLAFARAKDRFNNTRFAAEHPLSKQRAYNVLCWVQGHDARARTRWKLWRAVPFEQLSQAWNTILKEALMKPLP